MTTEAKYYGLDAIQMCMKEAGVSTLPWVPTSSLDDKFEPPRAKHGIFADNAASHLMKLFYVARLVRGVFGSYDLFWLGVCIFSPLTRTGVLKGFSPMLFIALLSRWYINLTLKIAMWLS